MFWEDWIRVDDEEQVGEVDLLDIKHQVSK
jgi:hypothetical protein